MYGLSSGMGIPECNRKALQRRSLKPSSNGEEATEVKGATLVDRNGKWEGPHFSGGMSSCVFNA